jgi:hypothetical protein
MCQQGSVIPESPAFMPGEYVKVARQSQENPGAITRWALDIMAAGHRLLVPAIADRYLSLSDSALRLAAKLWAQAGNAGMPTADPKELDCDVLIAAQALTMDIHTSDLVIATTNVGHLSLFVTADLWANITP